MPGFRPGIHEFLFTDDSLASPPRFAGVEDDCSRDLSGEVRWMILRNTSPKNKLRHRVAHEVDERAHLRRRVVARGIERVERKDFIAPIREQIDQLPLLQEIAH